MADQFDPRRAEPGQHFVWHDEYGVQHTLTADKDGVVRPASEVEARIADTFGLPIARKAIAEQKAAAAAEEG